MHVAPEDGRVRTGSHFLNGDVACAEGALAAGCSFFGGYPITPSTEVAEHMAERLADVGGTYVQMEDELASIASVLGASWGGVKAMTATSGPGFSLMMENFGLAFMTETPCVVVNVQRGGPSTGLPTMTAQGDVMQVKWGTHGDCEPIAYSPATAQEMFDYTVKAFNMAERFRTPVFVMADEMTGHLMERVVIPPADDISVINRKVYRPSSENGRYIYKPEADLVPPMPRPGEGHALHVTGLTHDERGYPALKADVHDRLIRRLQQKILSATDEIVEVEEVMLDDADVVLVSYGSTSRVARQAVREARRRGQRVGLLRLVTLWPFPGERIRVLSERVKAFAVVELNLGQMAREVERFTSLPVRLIGHAGGAMIDPRRVLTEIRDLGGLAA